MILNDIIHTHFNHTDDRLDCLIEMVYMKSPGIIILIGKNESLSGTFLQMLKQGSYRGNVSLFNINFINMLYIGKSIKIKPDGIYHLEHNDHNLTQFNLLEIERRYENQPSIVFVKFILNNFSRNLITPLFTYIHFYFKYYSRSNFNIPSFIR